MRVSEELIKEILASLKVAFQKIVSKEDMLYIEVLLNAELDVSWLADFENRFAKLVTKDYLAMEVFLSEPNELTIKISLA